MAIRSASNTTRIPTLPYRNPYDTGGSSLGGDVATPTHNDLELALGNLQHTVRARGQSYRWCRAREGVRWHSGTEKCHSAWRWSRRSSVSSASSTSSMSSLRAAEDVKDIEDSSHWPLAPNCGGVTPAGWESPSMPGCTCSLFGVAIFAAASPVSRTMTCYTNSLQSEMNEGGQRCSVRS